MSLLAFTNGTAAFYDRNIAQIGSLRAETERLQQQIATGNRLETASDDPVAASTLRRLSRLDRLAQVDSANAQRLGGNLRQADAALEGIASDLSRARKLAVQAANGALSNDQRKLIGEELAQIHTSLLASANSVGIDGVSLFAGQSDGPAYILGGTGAAIYNGSASAGEMVLGKGVTIPSGITGPEIFDYTSPEGSGDLFALVHNLAEALKGASPDPAAAAKAALGGFGDALESLTRAQTVIGVRAAWVETVQDRQIATAENRAQAANDAGGVDFASTVARLQQMLTVLEASQAAFGRVSRLSLFDTI
ncbi:MAG: flagellar biosynthesis protein FlgL [Pontixanthobacter sp.]